MTTITVSGQQAVSDVDTNMMGIRSKSLFEILKRIVVHGEFDVLNESEPDEVLGEIIEHITVSIPEGIFRTMENDGNKEFGRLKGELSALGDYLRDQFQIKKVYPFTIVRICELCYDPFKYFKVYELGKFVSAMTSCCLVKTSWSSTGASIKATKNQTNFSNGESDQEDVSLTKIPWIDEETEKELVPFIKEIDSIMGANLGFEDSDEDENMDVEINDLEGRNESEDFIIEGYYEDAPGGDDDSDDDDDDYVEGAQSEEDDDDSEDEEDRATSNGKRKPTEVDDYEYIEKTRRNTRVTTPKKLKAQSAEEQRPDVQMSSLEQQVSILISPEGQKQDAQGNI